MKEKLARLKWACRRGMLELDVILEPFVPEFPNLTAEDQQTFERLLSCDDPELFAWFMGHESCEDGKLAAMIKRVRDHSGAI
ncbi:succinate dehydrogenase assembly factor 2 [Corallincola platygyrae]|uniref:FAD assembly factor SdhE n=1 Tax=Corallincola platygyrae TaxID=1193278 RepID=A0ABW4XM91_9GAMM